MPSCVFRKCKNYTSTVKDRKDISFHIFPTNEVQLQVWIAIVREQRSEIDWTPSKNSRICSDHFHPDDKRITEKGRTFLKKDTVPIFVKKIEKRNIPSPSSLDDVSVSEIDEILENPIIFAYKKRVLTLELEKKQLQKKVKTVNRKNRRLKDKVINLAAAIKKYKNRDSLIKKQLLKLNLNPGFQDVINRLRLNMLVNDETAVNDEIEESDEIEENDETGEYDEPSEDEEMAENEETIENKEMTENDDIQESNDEMINYLEITIDENSTELKPFIG